MKKTKLVAFGLISLTALNLGVAAVHAADLPISTTTEGKIIFDVDDDFGIVPPDPVIPGGEEEGETIDPEGPGGEGNISDPDLKILFAPNLWFTDDAEDRTVTTASYNQLTGNTYNADLQFLGFYKPDNSTTTPNLEYLESNFVQIFNTKNIKDYTVTVTQTEKFKLTAGPGEPDSEIDATLSINEVKIGTGINNFGPTATTSGFASPFGLVVGTAKQIGSFTNNATTPEAAINSFMFGNYHTAESEEEKEEALKAVTLAVPAGEAIEEGQTYTTNLLWTVNGTI